MTLRVCGTEAQSSPCVLGQKHLTTKCMRSLLVPVAAVLFAGTLIAQTVAAPKSQMLVSTAWLSEHMADSSLVVLHVGSAKDYEEGHIPGARLVTLSDISRTDERGLTLQLPPVSTLQAAFEKLGVSDSSRIVLYPGNNSVQSATRVWFTLDYLGLGDRSSLLDGGLSAWKAENRLVVTKDVDVDIVKDIDVVKSGLTLRPRPELVVDAAWVQAHREDASVQVVDARTGEFYSGTNAGNMPRAGHIPGARSIPFASLLDEQRKLLPVETLRARFSGVQQPVSYCHIGQQATVVYFVARYLGMQPRLYDGSFQDWSARKELPVATAAQ